MMRALYSAASGMKAQQTNLDVISNNIANINSTGYKASTAEFKTLLYQTLQSRSTSANGENKPVGAQVGSGVRTASITTDFTQGTTTASDNDFACAIEGKGFFSVRGADGETYYTRNGNFQVGVTADGFMLCSSEGFPVLDSDGIPIEFGAEYEASQITFSSDGTMIYTDGEGTATSLGIRIGLYQFTNPAGLSSEGNTLYSVTEASGAAVEEGDNDQLRRSVIKAGYIEASNVQAADEMVNMIVAQRAYEMNSKAIQSADDMLSQANQLKR